MTTLEIFNRICERYNPALQRFRDQVIYLDGSFNNVGDANIQSMERIILRSLEVLVERERQIKVGQTPSTYRTRPSSVPMTPIAGDLDDFLGVAGKL